MVKQIKKFEKVELNEANPLCSFAETDELKINASFYKLEFDKAFIKYGSISNFESNNISFPYHYFTMQISEKDVNWETTDNRGKKKEYITGKYSISYTPPFTQSSERTDDYFEFVSILIEPDEMLLKGKRNSNNNLKYKKMNNISDPHLEGIFRLLLSEVRSGNENGRIFINHLIALLSIHFIKNYTADNVDIIENISGLTKDNINKLESYIEKNLSENISIDILADELRINKFDLIKRFKNATNLTPYQFVLQKKLEHSKNMLYNPKHTISEIAHILNFTDQSHFTKSFKKMYAQTPDKFRKEFVIA